MEVRTERGFDRDVRGMRDQRLLDRVDRSVADLEAALSIDEVRGIAQLQGSPGHYRIRIGDYRLGLALEDGAVVLIRFGHRRDFYRRFP